MALIPQQQTLKKQVMRHNSKTEEAEAIKGLVLVVLLATILSYMILSNTFTIQ
jgi:hypothetical protein